MNGNAVFHLLKYFFGIDKPESQTTQKERDAISVHASSALLAAEIGVFEGVNTVQIAKAISDSGKLFGIDPFFKGRLGICHHEQIARHEVRKNRISHKVQLLDMFSHDAVNKVPDNLDFIFVDGDHSYEGLQQDWMDWSAKLKPGGIIALHDTSIPQHDPSVAKLGSYKFFREVIINAPGFTHLQEVDSLNVLRKH